MKKSTIVKSTLKTAARQHKRALALLAVTTLVAVYTAPVAMAATLTSASLHLSDPRPSAANVKYTFRASSVSTSLTECIKFVFSTTVAGTTVPAGMNTASAALSTVGAETNYVPTPANWTANGSTTNGTVTIIHTSGETPVDSANRVLTLNGITNSNTADTTFFAKITTYGNEDCTTTPIDNSTIAFIITEGTAVTMTVDPTLTFSVAGKTVGASCNGAVSTVETTATAVPLGSLTTSNNSIGAQDLTVSTNAGTGYTVAARYSGKPTFGTNDIDDHAGTNGAPTVFSAAGTEAYGYTTGDATLGTAAGATDRFTGNKWAAFTTTNAEVAYSTNGVTAETTCIAHQAGVAALTAAGSYTTSAIYTATPIY